MPQIRKYYRPTSIDEALALIGRPKIVTAVLAGGTALVPGLEGLVDEVVDLQDLGLDEITVTGTLVVVGAMVRLQSLVTHPDVPEAVSTAAKREGPNTFRNAGTIGGVVASADWESELYATLLTSEATVTLQDQTGERTLPLASLTDSDLKGRILTAVRITRDGKTALERVARTPADDPIVAVIGRKGTDGKLLLAFCGVSDRPILLSPEEVDRLNPPSDFRGSSGYRREMAAVLCRRVLKKLA